MTPRGQKEAPAPLAQSTAAPSAYTKRSHSPSGTDNGKVYRLGTFEEGSWVGTLGTDFGQGCCTKQSSWFFNFAKFYENSALVSCQILKLPLGHMGKRAEFSRMFDSVN